MPSTDRRGNKMKHKRMSKKNERSCIPLVLTFFVVLVMILIFIEGCTLLIEQQNEKLDESISIGRNICKEKGLFFQGITLRGKLFCTDEYRIIHTYQVNLD